MKMNVSLQSKIVLNFANVFSNPKLGNALRDFLSLDQFQEQDIDCLKFDNIHEMNVFANNFFHYYHKREECASTTANLAISSFSKKVRNHFSKIPQDSFDQKYEIFFHDPTFMPAKDAEGKIVVSLRRKFNVKASFKLKEFQKMIFEGEEWSKSVITEHETPWFEVEDAYEFTHLEFDEESYLRADVF
jgi:hypothetical protein